MTQAKTTQNEALCTVTELAAVAGVTRQYIGQLRKENDDFPRPEGEKYRLGDFVRWYIEFIRSQANAGHDARLAAETRKLEAAAATAEIRLAAMQGEVIRVEDAVGELEETLSAIRSQLLAFPSKLAPQVVGMTAAEIEGLSSKLVHELLNELATVPERIAELKDTRFVETSAPDEEGADES